MARTTLLDVPQELLDRIFFYLDWDKTKSAVPEKDDIVCISLTCRHLRNAVLPILFRDVALRLRWEDDTLVEPALFRLRRDHPKLARHVKSVYLETRIGKYSNPDSIGATFALPENLQEWLDQADAGSELRASDLETHRLRVNAAAQSLLTEFGECFHQFPQNGQEEDVAQFMRSYFKVENMIGGYPISQQPSSHSENILTAQALVDEGTDMAEGRHQMASSRFDVQLYIKNAQSRALRQRFDALVAVILCLPPSMNSLVVESFPYAAAHVFHNQVMRSAVAVAVRIFGDRLKRLTLLNNPADFFTRPSRPATEDEDMVSFEKILSNLETIKSLVFSADHRRHLARRQRMQSGIYDSTNKWHALSPTVTRLELWAIEEYSQELTNFITGFKMLQDLTLNDIKINMSMQIGQQQPANAKICWLSFLIELRRLMKDVTFHLDKLKSWVEPQEVPKSGIQWLSIEAVPTGVSVDFQRETRLAEDYESFLALWIAEDSERGSRAEEDRADGRLVDLAMTSRWKTYANQRHG